MTRIALASVLLLAATVIGGVQHATPAAALDLANIMPVLAVGPGPDAEHPVIGYTLASNDGQATCELLRIDWATGLTSDLPATPTADACVTDLAVAPDGTVLGIAAVPAPVPNGVTCASADAASFCGNPLARLVTFAADGTTTSTLIGTNASYTFNVDGLGEFRGIAVDAVGVIYAIVNSLWVDVTTCAPAPNVGSVPSSSVSDGTWDWSSCLFTVDPSTGAMTLIGPSTLPGEVLAGLSIGSSGARTLTFLLAPLSVEPSTVSVAYWSAVNLGTGAVTPSGSTYSTSNGMFDQLRSGSIIFALVADPTTGAILAAVIDPLTGAITLEAGLVTELPPRPVTPTFTG